MRYGGIHRLLTLVAAALISGALSAAAQDTGSKSQIGGLLRRGRYQEAEQACRRCLADRPQEVSCLIYLGEAQESTGKYAEARRSYEEALRLQPRRLEARIRISRLLDLLGDRAAMRPLLIQTVNEARASDTRTAADETVLGEALYLLERFHEANDAFQRAQKKDPAYIPALIRRGQLFADKQDFPYAQELFKRALERDSDSVEAMIGMAVTPLAEGFAGPEEWLNKALKINPRSVEALNLLAYQAIQADAMDEAKQGLATALAVNPRHPETLGLLGVIHYFQDDLAGYRKSLAGIREICVSIPRVFEMLSEISGTRYRYQEAHDFARQAIAEDAQYLPAFSLLGINQLRLGDLEGGRKSLELAFERDPFDVRVKNTLDLLDRLGSFQSLAAGDFRILLSRDEAPVLGGYVKTLLEEAETKLSAKFRLKPQGPIQVEIYPDEGSFSVRTMGLVGLGALGACFGKVIVMDSPLAKKQGEYTWGGTLWHEYVHVLSLQKSAHRLPRWMSEGLSVMEERRARPGWGDGLTLPHLQAIQEGKLLEMARLNDGFHRPKSPLQIGLSYYQASKVCEYLESRFGWEKMLAMLDAYKTGADTERVFREVLAMDLAEFDRDFRAQLDREIEPYAKRVDFKLARTLQSKEHSLQELELLAKAHPEEFFVHLELGKKKSAAGDAPGAEQAWKKAEAAFPFALTEDSPTLQLAALYQKQGRKEPAAQALERFFKIGEGSHALLLKLARLQLDLGRKSDARQTLLQAVWVNPFEAEIHKMLGGLQLEAGQAREAIAEFQILIFLRPTDRAGAHYDLARALLAAGLKTQAKSEILKALEIAPSYAEAQELLLKIVGD